MDINSNQEFRKFSGEFNSKDKLTAFLYILLRDHLPAGIIETILMEHVKDTNEYQFTNGFLARYAQSITDRLK